MRRPPPSPALLVAVAVGGLLGALLRWGLGVLVPDAGSFPWTTVGINVSGSFVLATLPAFAVVRRHQVLPVFLGTGVLGGFTTLSTYAEQGRSLLADGRTVLALAYLLGTLVACLAAVRLAHHFSSRLAQVEFELEEGNE